MTYFFDTSALVKRYIQEIGSAWVSGICENAANDPIFISELAEVELLAAVHRRIKGKTITEESAAIAPNDFGADLADQYIAVRLTREILDSSKRLIEKHALRAYDAVQLATALECNRQQAELDLPAIEFLSADNELLSAASEQSLLTNNPNNHP